MNRTTIFLRAALKTIHPSIQVTEKGNEWVVESVSAFHPLICSIAREMQMEVRPLGDRAEQVVQSVNGLRLFWADDSAN